MNPVRPPLWLISIALVTAAFFVVDLKASVIADADTAIEGNQDTERLACLEAIANAVGDQAPAKATNDERSMIINRCLAQTGEFGAAMARACAEKDLASYEALLAYPEECGPFVVRCAKQVGQHSWGMVKVCVDKAIGAQQGSED